MRRVIRNQTQLANVHEEMAKMLGLLQIEDGALLLEFDEHQPPRTRRQQNKLHAMAGEMGAYVGEARFRDDVLKWLDIWPKKERWVTRLVEGDTTKKTRMIMPVSEAKLSKAQESLIIEWMYAEASTWVGFEWKHAE